MGEVILKRSLSSAPILLTVLIVISPITQSADAQSVGLHIGWYIRMDPASTPYNNSSFDHSLHQSPSYSVELHLRSILDRKSHSRFGFRISLLTIRSRPFDPSEQNSAFAEGQIFRMVSILIGYQRKIFEKDKLNLLLSFSAGPSFRTDKRASGFDHCDTAFCGFPTVNLSFQPGLTYVIQIKRDMAIQVNGRYNFLAADKMQIFPFSSGFLFEAGLLIEAQRANR